MKNYQVNPDQQQVLPTFDRAEVFGGSLFMISGEDVEWENDCAVQCILHIMRSQFGGADYETVAQRLHEKKEWSATDKRWSMVKKIDWMTHHLSPTLGSVHETLEELTGFDWGFYRINTEPTLREFAWMNRFIHVMAVSTRMHITAVQDGIIYDGMNSMNRKVRNVMLPARYHLEDIICS